MFNDEELEAKAEEAKLREKEIRRQQMDDIRTVMSNASGRRLMWRLLERAGTFSSIFNSDTHLMSYKSGYQDFGHFLMAEIVAADENLLLKIMKDNKKGESHGT